MKKLLGIFVLTAIVTVGSAFTAEMNVFDGPIISRESPTSTVWREVPAPPCNGALAACKVQLGREDVDESHFDTIGNAAPSTPSSPDTYQVCGIDHDLNPATPTICVPVTVLTRFAQ